MDDSIQKKIILQEFKKLDKDGSGYLTREELRTWLKSLAKDINMDLTENDIDQLIRKLDENKDGKVSIDEFEKFF